MSKWKVDPITPPGPRQVAAFNKAYRDFQIAAVETVEVTKDGFRMSVYSPFGCQPWNDIAVEIHNSAGEGRDWTLTRTNIGIVTAYYKNNLDLVRQARPVTQL